VIPAGPEIVEPTPAPKAEPAPAPKVIETIDTKE